MCSTERHHELPLAQVHISCNISFLHRKKHVLLANRQKSTRVIFPYQEEQLRHPSGMAPMLQKSCTPLAFLALYVFVGEVSGSALDMGEWTGGGWYIQNDGVMGGRSSGTLELADSGAKFEGSINLNGGGFASFRRSFAARDLTSYAGLWVEFDTLQEDSIVPLAVHIALNDASRRGLSQTGSSEI